MTFAERAQPLAERGFRVFPLIPKDKRPVRMSGEYDHFDAATTDLSQIRAWNDQEPNANVGLSPDEIFCFMETDDEAALKAACADLPPEVWDTTRVSARENRCYYIFRQTMRTKRAGNMTATREGQDNLFEFKQHRLYCVGPGSIHPKTGKLYSADWRPVQSMPDVLLNRLCELYGSPKPNAQAMSDDAKRETELLDRFLALYDVATLGEWFSKGKQWYRPIECPWASEHENPNEGTSTCIVYTEGGGYGFDCKHRCASKGWKEFRAELERRSERRFSFVGSETESVPFKEPTHENPSDPWAKYHTLDELLNVPPGRFIVDGILYDNSITALAGYAGDRKSIVSLNLAAACVTGKPFMGQFAVAHKPKRVIYLCPEMGLRELAKLSKTLGMLPYVGKTLFFRSLDKGGKIKLRDLTPSELDGSLVILDTAVRFIEGKENDPQDMAAFSDELFRLRNLGATVWVLFHSSKASVAQELSLQNAVRGSSEIAAMLSMCWATRLNDPAKRFESTSRMYPLKVREFEALPFDFGCDRATAACSIIGTPAPVAVLRTRKSDEKRLIIEELLKRDPDVGVNKIQAVLKERTGSGGNAKWVSDEKRLILAKLRGAGAVLVSA